MSLRSVAGSVDRVLEKIITWAGVLAAITGGAIALVVFWEVVARYVLKSPTDWSFEYSIYLLLGSAFLGMAYVLKEGEHVNVEVLVGIMPSSVTRILRIITNACGCIFSLVVVWQGWFLVVTSYQLKRVSFIEVPIFIPQLAIPIGASLLTVQFLRFIYRDITGSPDRGALFEGE